LADIEYVLGSVAAIRELYPPAEFANHLVTNYRGEQVTLRDYRDVIRHYTENSLAADQFDSFQVRVVEEEGVYSIMLSSNDPHDRLHKFGRASYPSLQPRGRL
jgi:hypothetical protein